VNRFLEALINSAMLTFQDFFAACSGYWTTERTYHFPLEGEIERSYTEFKVEALTTQEKQQILLPADSNAALFSSLQIDSHQWVNNSDNFPGFAISFETRSEKGEEVAMSLRALFVPDRYLSTDTVIDLPPLPVAAQVASSEDEVIQGFYLRDEGYSESGSIAGRFTYQPTRQTLEMTTYYRRSVAVDQMRFVSPNMRLRTIVTYRRSTEETVALEPPTIINLVGFGVERKQ
jgi:hypothetical protein